MKHKSVVIDKTHGATQCPHLTMQVETAASETSAKPQSALTGDTLTYHPRRKKTIIAFVDHPSKWNTTDTVTPLENITEAASLFTSHSMSTVIHKKVAVTVNSTIKYLYSIKKNGQTAEFSAATPEQSKFIKPVDSAILTITPEGYLDLTTYLK